MQVIKLSQTNDREAWLELRRGKIGGSDVKHVKPLSRGADRTSAGFWDLLAQKLSIAKDGEPERERGLRLENEALKLTAKQMGIALDLDCGMWVSDVDSSISVSPDSAEPSDTPTYAAEAKCLDSKNHLKAIVLDKRARKLPDYTGFASVPREYQDQVLQYFVVNEHLQTLYFTLYDDRMAYEHLMHHVITVTRPEVEVSIEQQLQMELDVIQQVNSTLKELINE